MQIEFNKKDILERAVEEIIEEKSFKQKLNSGRKLRIKLGIDPTGPDLHLGHTVTLWKLRQFQELGHRVVFIIGDFTATIGDPTGKNEARRVLTDQEIKRNIKYYIDSVGKILNIKKVEVHYNNEWYAKEGLKETINLARTATFQQITSRADFRDRIKNKDDITFSELFYPLLQGYDSVKVGADVEIGGTDQKFNLLMGRQVQSRFGQPKQDIMTLPLLLGIDGVHKMSKSLNNYIALQDKPDEMFGKVMSIRDKEISAYYEGATPVSYKEIEKLRRVKIQGKRARDLKFNLAKIITEIYWGKKEAEKAAQKFEKVFKQHEVPKNLKVFTLSKNTKLVDLLIMAGLVASKGEARRYIQQGAVRIDGEQVLNTEEVIKPVKNFVLNAGKRKIIQVRVKKMTH